MISLHQNIKNNWTVAWAEVAEEEQLGSMKPASKFPKLFEGQKWCLRTWVVPLVEVVVAAVEEQEMPWH